jgi:DNA-binding phage protein
MKRKTNGQGPRTVGVYFSYNFIDKDPIIDKMRTAVQDSGLDYKRIHERSNVSTTTLYNWFDGQTRTPRFATVAAVAHALGREVGLVKMRPDERDKVERMIVKGQKEQERLKAAEAKA